MEIIGYLLRYLWTDAPRQAIMMLPLPMSNYYDNSFNEFAKGDGKKKKKTEGKNILGPKHAKIERLKAETLHSSFSQWKYTIDWTCQYNN